VNNATMYAKPVLQPQQTAKLVWILLIELLLLIAHVKAVIMIMEKPLVVCVIISVFYVLMVFLVQPARV